MRALFSKRIYLLGIGIILMTIKISVASTLSDLQIVAKKQPQLVACEWPRPIICQPTYDPVCGIFLKPLKKTQTFRNSCIACQNTNVQGFEYGKCLKDLKR